jgi:hypothetical protein
MRQRTALSAVAIALAMGLTAGCGGEGNTAGKSQPREKTAAATPAGEAPPTQAPSARHSPKGTLQSRLGEGHPRQGRRPWLQRRSLGHPTDPGARPPTSPSAPPLTAVINGKPEPLAYRQLTGAKDDRPAVSEFLTAQGAQGAATVLSRLRAAVEASEGGFKASGGEGPSTYRA